STYIVCAIVLTTRLSHGVLDSSTNALSSGVAPRGVFTGSCCHRYHRSIRSSRSCSPSQIGSSWSLVSSSTSERDITTARDLPPPSPDHPGPLPFRGQLPAVQRQTPTQPRTNHAHRQVDQMLRIPR